MNEYLALIFLTLEKLSEQAGKPLDKNIYLNSLLAAKASGHLFEYRINDKLLGFATLKKLDDEQWFISLFVTHPEHRTKKLFRSLFAQVVLYLQKCNAKVLVSNVYKTNKSSVAFHRRIGFKQTRENEVGYEFTLQLTDSFLKKWLNWPYSSFNKDI